MVKPDSSFRSVTTELSPTLSSLCSWTHLFVRGWAGLAAAMSRGGRVDWDYQPRRDASEEYVRNHMDWTAAAATTRFPPIEGAASRS